MVILETVFEGARTVDGKGRLCAAKTKCLIRRTPFGRTYYINGMQVSERTCLELVRKKRF